MAKERTEATIFTDKNKFLLAAARDKRDAWQTQEEGFKEVYYGLANTEGQFREALCQQVFPVVQKLTAREVQDAMAEAFAEVVENGKSA